MKSGLTRTVLALGFLFLYGPIALLILYSFNASRLVAVWGGFSLHWYAALWQDEALLDSAWISARIALVSAALATVVGTAAAYALARFGRFSTRLFFVWMVYAPLVMPDVIAGLSLLLLFVALDIDRGFWTVVIAHATLSMGFVAVLVQARFAEMDPAYEDAALDLGATPIRAFWSITLPLAAPAIAAGFLLATTLSLDDVVIASFTSGPGATTLPMRIYSQVRLGITPEINAISTVLIAVVALCLASGTLILRWRARRLTALRP